MGLEFGDAPWLALPSFIPRGREAARGGSCRSLAEYITAEPDFVMTCLDLPDSPADEELFGEYLAKWGRD